MKNKLILYNFCFIILLACCSDHIENPEVIAHRGGAVLAPENTIAAFENAIELNSDMIEIDVMLSKDDKVIVIHDDKLDRTTDGSGKVNSLTLQQIKKFDAGSWFDERFAGEKIPTLDEVLEQIDSRVVVLIEIKGGDEKYPGLEKAVVESVEKFNAEKWIVIQSFNRNTVERIEKYRPDLITFYLLGKNFSEFLEEISDSDFDKVPKQIFDGVAPHFSHLSLENINLIREAGFKIFTWTVNKKEDMQRLIDFDLDGIITDSPDLLIEILNKPK